MSKNKTLADYGDQELIQELSERGYTVVNSISPPKFEAVEWPNPPPFGAEGQNPN